VRCADWLSESHTAEFFYERMISLSALASLPQPDGLGSWAQDGREVVFMLEYDTGSEHLAQLARGQFPCLVIRVGDLHRVSTADLLRLLGTSANTVHAPPTAA
jgi:Replication-relaxation